MKNKSYSAFCKIFFAPNFGFHLQKSGRGGLDSSLSPLYALFNVDGFSGGRGGLYSQFGL